MELLKNFAGLNDEEVELIDEPVREKLIIAFDSLRNDSAISKEKLDCLEVDRDQLLHNYKQKVDELQKNYNELMEKSADYDKLLSSADSKFREAYAEKNQLQSKLDETLAINNELTFAIRNLENEKDILFDQLKYKLEQMEGLNDELKKMRAEADDVRKVKIDALFKLEEASTKESSIKAQEMRWSEEISSLQRHTEWLEDRLRQTTDQLLTVRRDTSTKTQSLESELDLRKTELENAKKTISNLEESVRKLTTANEDYIQKIRRVAEEQIRIEQLYGNELDAQKQVVSLYKDQLKEAEEKNAELTEAITSMQGMLKAAYENISRLESDKSALRQQFIEEKSKLEVSSQQLATELEQNRQLLDKFRVDGLSEDELRQLNPAVAATLSALKRGHSLTELYADYIQLVEDRDQLRLDKQRLTEYVKQLVDDLKEKAPVLRDQQERYRKMQSQVKELSAQLESVTEKLDEAQAKRQEMQRRAGYYQRESGRLKQTCSDLSRQVQLLLREVEVLRGTVVEDPEADISKDGDGNSNLQPDRAIMQASDFHKLLTSIASSAATVIDDHLVTWRGLQELQLQNQRLLCVARDLATQLEQKEHEEQSTAGRISELTVRLETLSGELDVVKMAAREARAEVQAVTRQRNIYRGLLSRYDIEVSKIEEEEQETSITEQGEELQPSSENAIVIFNQKLRQSPTGKLSDKAAGNTVDVGRLEESLASLDAEFKRYREDKLESDKIYSTTIEQLRKETSEARLLNQKLAAQLDFTHEKLRTMEANVSGYKQEITVLREMNARYSTSAAASEAELARLREDLLRTSDKLLEVEVDARHATRQLELARANENRWRQETEALRRQDQMHTQLMHQLEAIQGNLEQREANDRSSLERRIAQLEKQLSDAQSAFTESSQSCKTIKQTLEHELELTRQKLNAEQAETDKLRTQLTIVEQELEGLKPKQDTKNKEDSDEPDERMLRETAIESASRIRELQLEVDGLRSRLEAARNQTEQMRQLSTEAETRLNEVIDENKQLEQRLSQELEESKQRCDFLEAQLDLEKKERQNLVNENIRTTEEAHQMNAELRRELASLQSELESTKARCESALQLEAGAKTEIEAYERIAQEARQKYERELGLHAEDVEALTEVRKQSEEAKIQVADLQRQLTLANTKAETASEELTAQNTLWESERETLNAKLQQADKDQSLLQEQLVKLTQQLISLRKVMEKVDDTGLLPGASSTDADESSGVSDLKTSEDLLQLVGYLRRQKSIAEASCDASSAEISRLLLRISSLEQQKDHLQNELDRERKASELATETSQRHSELMERVEQLNLVTESNRMLRHERETLRNSLSEIERQVEEWRARVVPLREANSSLQARVDSLALEHQSLEEERDRWKERCNRLVETAQRMDPEQYRLACNERDELQRKLRRVEEEVQQLNSKLNDLRDEMDERAKKFDHDLTEANTSRQDAETRCTEYSSTCDSLRKDLEAKDTTIFKLREIGRKYRQESETLRRQLAVNRSDEAQLQSVNEALTEAKADVVTLRADLSSVRTQYSQLSSDFTEACQILEELKSSAILGPIVSATQPQTSSDSGDGMGQSLLRALRATFAAFAVEIDRLTQQADAQRERLLRMQLVESQLTKSLRQCAELRTLVNELQSAHPMSQGQSTATTDVEPSEPSHSFALASQMRTSMHAAVSEPAMEANTSSEGGATVPSSSTLSLTQPVPAWIVRAAAAVQPVHPTPAVTPPNSVSGLKQTAEIRPITSNVATVIPTPALQPVSLAASTDLPLTSTAQVGTTPTNIVESNVSTGALNPAEQQSLFRSEPVSGSLRNAVTRRPQNSMGQPVSGDSQPVATSSTTFSWLASAGGLVSSASLASVSGKRRLDEQTSVGESSSAHITNEEAAMTSLASPDSARPWDGHSGVGQGTATGFPFLFSEAKRLRQTGTTAPLGTPVTQTGQGPIVLGRPSFGHSNASLPAVHATAPRLFSQPTEHAVEGWSNTTGGVTGIVNPLTPASVSVAVSTSAVVEPPAQTSIPISPVVHAARPTVNTEAMDTCTPTLSRNLEERIAQSAECESEPTADEPAEVSEEFPEEATDEASTATRFLDPGPSSLIHSGQPQTVTQVRDFTDAETVEGNPSFIEAERAIPDASESTSRLDAGALYDDQQQMLDLAPTEGAQEVSDSQYIEYDQYAQGPTVEDENAAVASTEETAEVDDEDEEEEEGIDNEEAEDDEDSRRFDSEGDIEHYSEVEEEEVEEGDEEEEDEDLDETVQDEVIELSSDSERSGNGDEQEVEEAKDDAGGHELSRFEQQTEDSSEPPSQQHTATKDAGDEDNTMHEEEEDVHENSAEEQEEEVDEEEEGIDAVEDDDLAEDELVVSQSHADSDLEAERVGEDSQLTSDAPDQPPSNASGEQDPAVSSASAAAVSSSAVIASGSLASTTTGNLFATVSTSGGDLTSKKVGLFSNSDETSGSASSGSGLFAGFRPSTLGGSAQLGTKFSQFNTGFEVASSSSTGGLFRHSVLSAPTASSTSSVAQPVKPSLFGHSTPAAPAEQNVTADGTSPGRPKIQPIIWDSNTPPSSSPSQPSTDESSRLGAGRRKKWGSSATESTRARSSLFSARAGANSTSTPGGTFSTIRGGTPGSAPPRSKPHPRR